jgi:hypothetical protein
MTIQEILAATDTLPDSTEIPFGEHKVKLGDIRGLTAKEKKDLSEKMAGAESREKEARDTAMKAATLLSQLEEARTKLVEQKTTPVSDDDFDTSEWWKPVKTRFEARDKKIDEAITKLENLTKAVTQTATIWAEDRWQSQYERNAPRLKKVEAYKDWDYTKVRDYAAANKILDAHGLPSVEKTILELTKANDLETARKEAYEEGLKKGRTQQRMDNMPRPSSASGGKAAKGKSAVEEMGFEGLGDDVMGDEEIMESLAKIQDIGSLQ